MINTKQSVVDGIGQSATYIQKDLTRNLPYSGLPNQSQVGKKLKEKSKTIKLVEENNEKNMTYTDGMEFLSNIYRYINKQP